jgi:hypothetical protein
MLERAAAVQGLTKQSELELWFADASVDCVFIGGLRDYRNVVTDIGAWAPKVKSAGLTSGHDWPPPQEPGKAAATPQLVMAHFANPS